uniref:PiggyBac transposable element-derived protein 4 C-terminal zinc-ribbon domain-containing protein n=1 Tax=Glossina brevipalpis TaxID=37001 RepID=A0A1A9WLT3_9MUSC
MNHNELFLAFTELPDVDIKPFTNESSCNLSVLSHQQQPETQLGVKRNRVLTRQPRVKRDSDSLSNNQASPEPTVSSISGSGSSNVNFETFGSGVVGQTLYSSSHHVTHQQQQQQQQQQHHHHHHHHLLTVPPRIERHSSEPAPNVSPTSPHLLTVPQNTPFLIKQHSDPLLPSQHTSAHSTASSSSNLSSNVTNPFVSLHRQYSHPLSTTNASYVASSAPLQHSQHISLPESIYASSSPPPAGSSQYIVPQQIQHSQQTNSGSGNNNSVTSSATATSPVKTLSLPQFTTIYLSAERSSTISSPPISRVPSVQLPERFVSGENVSASLVVASTSSTLTVGHNNRLRTSKSLQSHGSTSPSTLAVHTSTTSSSFEHIPTLRVRNEELQRSVSSPQTSREIIILENPRSSHCPVIRPGPALGCNFCWNTIDGHGRILRRKTKYHCPECQTNLCIVPCFQEYHERLNNEVANATASTQSTTATIPSTTISSSSSSSNTNTATVTATNNQIDHRNLSKTSAIRHFTKTEKI